jgi:hypothetical protein
MGRQAVDNLTLERWRSTDAVVVLGALSRHMKQDLSYTPRTDRRTSRWHINVAGRDLEILCDGPKFFDTRAGSGGGGALDLVMHLFRLDFRGATKLLREKQL